MKKYILSLALLLIISLALISCRPNDDASTPALEPELTHDDTYNQEPEHDYTNAATSRIVRFYYHNSEIDPNFYLLPEAYQYVSEEIDLGDVEMRTFIRLMYEHTGIRILNIWAEGGKLNINLDASELEHFDRGTTGSLDRGNILNKTIASLFYMGSFEILVDGQRGVMTNHFSFNYEAIVENGEIVRFDFFDPLTHESPSSLHPLAEALSEFFVNLAPVPYWHPMSSNSHAILVDVDGNGTQGVIAAKWSADRQHYLPNSTGDDPIFVQRFFLLSNNHARPVDLNTNFAVTPNRRLIGMSNADGQGISLRAYTLFNFVDGNLVPTKSISATEYWRREGYGYHPNHDGNSYLVNYHTADFPDFWNRNHEQDQTITHEEFNELLIRYGLHDTITSFWELPDDTAAILQMPLN
ncbi:MAG: hypothetical protein FWE29_01940 [Defluviitaleaceae bacterium]|nr:hypothetical protein [Defluviitaleaceae bacterium]